MEVIKVTSLKNLVRNALKLYMLHLLYGVPGVFSKLQQPAGTYYIFSGKKVVDGPNITHCMQP